MMLIHISGYTALTLWTFGVQISIFKYLHENHHNLFTTVMYKQFGFLYQGYTVEYWYWEFVKRVQVFTLVMIPALPVTENQRAIYGMLACFVFLLLHVRLQPFENRNNQFLDYSVNQAAVRILFLRQLQWRDHTHG